MEYEHILFEETDGFATLTINRPAVLNALAARTLEELIQRSPGGLPRGRLSPMA